MRLGRVRAVFTDRHGGTSPAPYASANLGDHVGDDAERVARNRRALADAMVAAGHPVPADPARWTWLRQVHGTTVVDADEPVPHDRDPHDRDPHDRGPAAGPPEGDAAVTGRPGVALVVLAADCAPVLLAAPDACAVVHAGWPGLERGVLEAAAAALRARSGGAVRAVLGPCVHPASYEFGPDLLDRLAARLGDGVRAETAAGRPALDIPAAVRAALRGAGVHDVTDLGICTSASPDHFSHRRDGVTGRHGLVAVLEP